MNSKGIRIEGEKKGRILSVALPDILEKIHNGNDLFWSIMFLEGIGNLGRDISMPVFEKQILESEKVFFIDWIDLVALAKKFHQIIWITIIGCKDRSFLRRYENDQDMFEACDIVIELIDSGYWEVFSKDMNLIGLLAAKFEGVEFLETDYEP